jgi:hypothetical protein
MYRVTVSCGGIDEGQVAAACRDIVEEFSHRPWHQNVACHWTAPRLHLVAENDYDSDGLALLDEFRDAVFACVVLRTSGTIDFNIESVVASDASAA